MVAQQFEHSSGAGAEIDQRIDDTALHCFDNRRFNRRLGHMQAPEFVPPARDAGKIGSRLVLLRRT
jgi:hypothetical protein